MSEVYHDLAQLSADIRATLEWARLTGAEVLPREKLERLVAVPIARTTNVSRRAPAPAPSRPSRPRSAPVVQTSPAVVTPVRSEESVDQRQRHAAEERPRRMKASSKWSALMDGPPTHTVTGPKDARLVILRGAGSSPDAEEMLSRMLENVLKVQRHEVAVYDLARDGREPSVIGLGIVDALSGSAPEAVIVMGAFAARAMLGDDATVGAARGRWATLKWTAGSAQARVTHHPEAIIALAARGEAGAKREAFEDLKAVMAVLS